VFGKWDGGSLKRYLPLQRGFDVYFGFPNTGIDYFTHERYGVPSMYRDNSPVKVEGYSTELFTAEALKFVEKNKDRPFFLYSPYNAPHMASNFEHDVAQVPAGYTEKMYPGKNAKDKRTIYMACITYMDECIGRVLNRVSELALEKETLVVFFSDNGGAGVGDNGPLRGKKAMMFEGGIRVPMMAKFQGRIPSGQVSHEFLTALEVFPTLTKLVGAELPKGVIYDGFDAMGVLEGREKSKRTEMFWQRRGDRAARVGNIKWVDSEKGRGVFDLASDVGEKKDLSKDRPELAQEMEKKWEAWRKQMDEAEPRGPFRDY